MHNLIKHNWINSQHCRTLLLHVYNLQHICFSGKDPTLYPGHFAYKWEREQQPTAELSVDVENTNPSSLNDMFAQLLGEIKNLSSGMAALHEARLITSEAEQDDGQAERADDDEAWLNAELDAQRDAEQADDQLSLDTQVNNLITTQPAQQILSKPHVLTSIAPDLAVEEKTGQVIHDELVAILSSLLKERLAEDKLQEKLKKYPQPANVEFLRTSCVNPLIWGQILHSTRTGDTKSQKFQHVLIGAVNAVVKAIDYLLNKGGEQELLTMLTDSIAFMLQCNHEYNHSR